MLIVIHLILSTFRYVARSPRSHNSMDFPSHTVSRNSLCTRLLYTVLPSPYRKKSFQDLLAVLVKDLTAAEKDGITVSWSYPKMLVSIMIFSICPHGKHDPVPAGLCQ